MKIKTIIVTCLIILALIAFGIFGGLFGSGNFAYAQVYEFGVDTEQLIKAIKDFKKENRTYNPPSFIEPDTLNNSSSHFDVSIYFKDENTIVCFFIEEDYDNPNKSYIKLVSMNKGLQNNNYKVINKDLKRSENSNIKKDFEERVLNKLNLHYENRGNGMFIFWK